MTAQDTRSTWAAVTELGRIVHPVRWRFLWAAVLSALATASAVGLLALSAWLIARAAQQPPVLTLMVAVVGVRTLGISRGLLRYVERLMTHDAVLRALAELRSKLMERLTIIAPTGLPAWHRGDLLGRTINDVDEVQDLLLRVMLPLASSGTVIVGTVVGIWLIDPTIALLLGLCLLLCTVAAPLLAAPRIGRMERDLAGARALRTTELWETFDGIAGWASLGAVERRVHQARQIDQRIARSTAGRAKSASRLLAIGVLGNGCAAILAALIGIPAVTAGTMHPVVLAVVVLTPLALAEVTGTIAAATVALPRSLAAAHRVVEVLGIPDPMPTQPDRLAPFPQTRTGPVIRLQDVSARWPGALEDTLTGINLELRPGKRVVICGESGSGKSTLLAVLLGFLPVRTGEMTVDGVTADEVDRDRWREMFGWTGDPGHTFATSVAENLRFARPGCDDEQLRQALIRVGLGEWLAHRGLAAQLGEHGTAISGGEQKRIALARALLADRPILLADEPVEQVEPELASRLVEDLLAGAETGGESARCTVVVTHRRADTLLADEVIELSGGKIVNRQLATV